MKTNMADRLLAWVQILTGIAVLVGLGLVVAELRQTRELALLEQATGAMDFFLDERALGIGEVDVASIAVKGCLEPESLTLEEAHVYYETNLLVANANRLYFIEVYGGFDSLDWAIFAKEALKEYLGTKAGLYHYHELPEEWNPAVRAIADEIIANGEAWDCRERLRKFHQIMTSEQVWWKSD
ncbi:MAG: hypothetical protein AAF542_25905 [Pseudomonadota bacterium]